MRRMPDTFEVDVLIAGVEHTFAHPEPADAYALAVLALLERIA